MRSIHRKLPLRLFRSVLGAALLLLCVSSLRAQDKTASSNNLKIGFLMDSLKVERWQTDLDKFKNGPANSEPMS